jgi:Ca2+/Na+ antiporter
MGIIIPLVLVIICSLVIWRAVDGFEVASDYLGRNLSDGVKGATINAIASSMPELFTTFVFLFFLSDVDGFAGGIGTTAGSAIYNGMMIPALVILTVIGAGLAKNIFVTRKVLLRDGVTLIVAEFILIMLISNESLDWHHGLILMVIYFFYIYLMLSRMDRSLGHVSEKVYNEEKGERDEHPSILKAIYSIDLEHIVLGKSGYINTKSAWWLLSLAVAIIAAACYYLVLACEWLGSDTYTFLGNTYHGLDIPIMFVAMILAAAASSVPDTLISIKDAKKGNYDDALSNALGSNMFDICFALGFPLFLFTLIYGPITMSPEVIEQSAELRMLLLLVTIMAFFIFISGKVIGKIKAFLLLGIYVLFVTYIVGRSFDMPAFNAVKDVLVETVHFFQNIFYGK